MDAHLHAVATALPPNPLPQDLVARRAREIFGPRCTQFDRLARTFSTAGVEARFSVAPIDWFSDPHGWQERNDIYLDGASALFEAAARRCLGDAHWAPESVDVVVTVSSTGVATPTLEAKCLSAVGFRSDILRVPVFGLGCAGGISGLAIARSHALAAPGSRVLLVVVEACTVSFRADQLEKADIISTVLFGDGAAAACLSTEPATSGARVVLGHPSQKTWPDTLEIMGWDVDDTGLGVVFDRSIPDFVLTQFSDAVDEALAAAALTRDEVARFVCHPGGAKVIEAIERTLQLPPGTLAEERDVLRRFGNMSAPTVLFVLRDVLGRAPRGQMLACALGPGFTAAFLPIRIEDRPRAAHAA